MTKHDGIGAAIVGSGNIGTDLMMKILKGKGPLTMTAMVGIDPASDGLARARDLGVTITDKGLEGLAQMPEWDRVRIVFDATSAKAHAGHYTLCRNAGKQMVDLTPAAAGPYVVPVVNLEEHLARDNVNLVTCGGQATIPMVHAVKRVSERVPYAEIVASVSSRSAGPGTRANIDEFTQTTARGIETVGGADRGKAIIILNPADPPMIMRDTVFALSQGADEAEIAESVEQMAAEVQAYVPGYRLKQKVQFERFGNNDPLTIPGYGTFEGVKSTIFLEVEGAADYLPAYAGNLDIMTAAGLATAERIASLKLKSEIAL